MNPSSAKPARREGIELMRFVAAVAVVFIHFWPRLGSSPHATLDALVVGTSRFAVPFFFVVSGHFLSRKIAHLGSGLDFARKWVPILVGWHAIHALWFTVLHLARSPQPWSTVPDWVPRLISWNGLLEGVGWHLWYLHSLVFSVLAVAILPSRWRRPGVLLPFAGGLFALALAWGPWHALVPTVVQPAWIPVNPRGFLFTAFLPFLLGWFLPSVPSKAFTWFLIATGAGVQTLEILRLGDVHGAPPEYFAGSVLLGWGLVRAALDWNPGAGWARWGAASLPMYLAQFVLFSPMAKAIELCLDRWIVDPWVLGVVGLLGALPLYAGACLWIANTPFWRRVHS